MQPGSDHIGPKATIDAIIAKGLKKKKLAIGTNDEMQYYHAVRNFFVEYFEQLRAVKKVIDCDVDWGRDGKERAYFSK